MNNKSLLLVAVAALAASFYWNDLQGLANRARGPVPGTTDAAVAARFQTVAARGAERVTASELLQTDEDVVRCVELAFMVEFNGTPPATLAQLQADLAKALGHSAEDVPKPLTPQARAAAAAVLRQYGGVPETPHA